MTNFPVMLAHGALGLWDEAIFLTIALAFLVFMGISWVKGRNAEPETDEATSSRTSSRNRDTSSDDRFRLD
jgi:hypothetical protein